MDKYEWIKEDSYVDFRSGYEWKIGKIKKIGENSVELVPDDLGYNKKNIRFEELAPFRKFSGIKALGEYAGPVNISKVRVISQILNKNLKDLTEEDLRGNLPMFIYGFNKSDISEMLDYTKDIYEILFRIIKLITKLLQVYSQNFENWPNLNSEERKICETWPEMLDMLESILGKEEVFKNFYEICEYLPEEFEARGFREGLNLTLAALVSVFYLNKGVFGFSQLFKAYKKRSIRPFSLVLSINLEFYKNLLAESVSKEFLMEICGSFIEEISEKQEGLVKAEEFQKAFKNLATISDELSGEHKQKVEIFYLDLIFSVFFSNNLEKRLKSVNEICCFVDKKTRFMSDSELLAKIEEQRMIESLLEGRAHHQLLKKSHLLLEFLAKHGKFSEKYLNMLVSIKESSEKVTAECFPGLLATVFPHLTPAQQACFKKPEASLSPLFYTQDKVFSPDLFSFLQDKGQDFTQIQEILKKVSETVLDPSNNSIKSSFLDCYAEQIHNQRLSFQYFSVLLSIIKQLTTEDLNVLYKKQNLDRMVLENLEGYIKKLDPKVSKTCQIFKIPHFYQISLRFEFLEYIQKYSKYNISPSTIQNLLKLCLFQTKNETVKSIFTISLTRGHKYTPILSKPSVLLSFIDLDEFYSTFSSYSFNIFKHLFFKVNAKKSLQIEDGKFVCVLDKKIEGFGILLKLLYRTKGLELRKTKKLLRSILSCYSLMLTDNACEIFSDNLQLLWMAKEEKADDLSRYFSFVHDLIINNSEKSDKTVEVTLLLNKQQVKYNFPITCSINYVRNFIAINTGYDMPEISFRFKEKLYSCKQNMKMIRFENGDVLEIVPQSLYLELGYNYITSVLKEFRQIFWKFGVSEQPCRKQAFEVALRLDPQAQIVDMVEKLQLNEEIFNVENLEVAVQLIISLNSNLKNEEWVEMVKKHSALQLIYKNIAGVLKFNHIRTDVIWYCLNFVGNTLSVPVAEPEKICEIYFDTFFWIGSNVFNKDLFKWIFGIISQLTHLMLDNYRSDTIMYCQNVLKQNMQGFIEIFEKFDRQSSDAEQYIEYFRFYSTETNLLEDFLTQSYAKFPESLQNLPFNGLLIVYEQLLKPIQARNPQSAEALIKSLFRFAIQIHELPEQSNKNLTHLYKILQKYPQYIPNINIEAFIHEILFVFPDNSNKTLPKCKSNDSRKEAFFFTLELCKHDQKYLGPVLARVQNLNQSIYWRTPQEKHWNIQINSIKKPFNGFVGLKNPSCICYSNSLIQQLFYIESFRELIIHLDSVSEFLQSLQEIFFKLKFSYKSSVSGKSVVRSFHQYRNYSEQMDADEYFSKVLEKISAYGPVQAGKILNIHFMGTQLLQVISQECDHVYPREQNFYSFNVNLSADSLTQSLENYFSGELLQYENAFYCENCNKKVTALLKPSFKTLPNYLVFTLKRFEYDLDSNARIKLLNKFVFEEKLNLGRFLTDINEIGATYRLKGITLHAGNTDHGHYFCYIRTGEDYWLEFNDSLVQEISKEKLLKIAYGGKNDQNTPSAYILVYEKEHFAQTESQKNFIQQILSVPMKQDLKIHDKNKHLKIKEIVFSDNYLDFIDKFIEFNGTDQIVSEFMLTAFIRMSLNGTYQMKIFKKCFDAFTYETVAYVMNVICSDLGCKEFIVFNQQIKFHRFFILIIKKFIHYFPLEFLQNCFLSLCSVLSWIHSNKKDAPETIFELLYLICSLIPDTCEKYNVCNYFLRIFCRCYPEFPFKASPIDINLLCKENYSEINPDLKFSPSNFSPLIQFLANNLFLVSEQDVNYIKSDAGWNKILQFRDNKQASVAMTQIYCNLYNNDIEGAINYLNHLLELYMTGEVSYLRLISMFINRYSKRIEILTNFLDFYVNLIPNEMDHNAAVQVRYLVKMVRKVKMSEIVGVLSQELVTKMQVLVACFLDFRGNNYDSGKIKKIFEVFSEDLDEDVNDSDDEIDEKYLQPGKIVFYCEQNESKKMEIEENLNGELFLLKGEDKKKLIDKTELDRVQISYLL